jgi:hypothetical protein
MSLVKDLENAFSQLSRYESQDLSAEIKTKIVEAISKHNERTEKVNKLAIQLSNYSTTYDFLFNEISSEDLDRLLEIDWGKYETGEIKPCSGNFWEIEDNLKSAVSKKDANSFIKYLNQLIGNCCMTTIYDLDNEL